MEQTQLPEEIRLKIEQEATNLTLKLKNSNDYQNGYIHGLESGYEKGATAYALQAEELRRENTQIRDAIKNALVKISWEVPEVEITDLLRKAIAGEGGENE